MCPLWDDRQKVTFLWSVPYQDMLEQEELTVKERQTQVAELSATQAVVFLAKKDPLGWNFGGLKRVQKKETWVL